MEAMRQGIGLQAFGQRDPLVVYQTEGHTQFQQLLATIRHDVVRIIFHVSLTRQEAPKPSPVVAQSSARTINRATQTAPKVADKKVGRNDPCPCGSGKKYKKCCGAK